VSATTTSARPLIPKVPADTARPLYAYVFAEDVEVRACERDHLGLHKYVLIEVMYEIDSEFVAFCARCGVRQCATPVVETDPASECMLARGHPPTRMHRDTQNRWREVATA
jgi:hypothetical protein